MAVQKSKKTRSKIGMRRSHNKLKIKNFSIDLLSKEKHICHRITKTGYFKGKNILIKK